MRIQFVLFASLLAFALGVSVQRPVIGVLTQPANFPFINISYQNYSYIGGSYIQHLQSAGAQVVPIQWDLPEANLSDIFNQINGLLLPGGGAALNNTQGSMEVYARAGEKLINMAYKANLKGDFFPVFGICLGYEMMTMVMAQNSSILVSVETGADSPKNLFTTVPKRESMMFKDMDDDLYFHSIKNDKIAYFHHRFTVDPEAWEKNKHLKGNFTVTSITNDTKHKTYATTVEGKKVPFFGAQFHPEKNTFEWATTQNLPHSDVATRFQQHWAHFFVNHTRLNNHVMTDELFETLDIRKITPWHISDDPEFERLYLFQNYKLSKQLISIIPSNIPYIPAVAYGRTPKHPTMDLANATLNSTSNITTVINTTTITQARNVTTTLHPSEKAATKPTEKSSLHPTFLSLNNRETEESQVVGYNNEIQLEEDLNMEVIESSNNAEDDFLSWLFFP